MSEESKKPEEMQEEESCQEVPEEEIVTEETGGEEEPAAEEAAAPEDEKPEKKDKKTGQIEELTDRLQRTMAEFDNFRKRTEKEKASMYVVGAKEVVEKILPVVDNFEPPRKATRSPKGCRWSTSS